MTRQSPVIQSYGQSIHFTEISHSSSAPLSTITFCGMGRRIIVVQIGSGRNHRVHAVFLLHAEIDHDGAGIGFGCADGGFATSERCVTRMPFRPYASAIFTKSGLRIGVAA